MMLFQSELCWNMMGLSGRFVKSGCLAPLQKQETKVSMGARPLPLRCLSQFFPMKEKINCLKNKVLCVPDLVFIVGDFPNLRVTRTLSYLMVDFFSLSLSD